MALPSKRRPSSSRKRRASHFALKPIAVSNCPHCTAVKLPHRVCGKCGMYRDRQILPPKAAKKSAKG